MKNRFLGVLSILFVAAALIIGCMAVLTDSLGIGLLISAATALSLISLMGFYCRKCPHVENDTCRHVVVGLITKRLFRAKKPSAYTPSALLFAFLPITFTLIAIQFWLVSTPAQMIGFWVSLIIAVVLIRFKVCPDCANNNCPMNSSYAKQR